MTNQTPSNSVVTEAMIVEIQEAAMADTEMYVGEKMVRAIIERFLAMQSATTGSESLIRQNTELEIKFASKELMAQVTAEIGGRPYTTGPSAATKRMAEIMGCDFVPKGTGSDELVPFAYAYRYPTFPPAGATVIRFGTNGREINGAKPIETIPLYRRAIATPDTDRVAVLTEAVTKCRDFLRSAPLESGVCCCGNPVEGHGYGDGHSPVDELQYHAGNLAEELDAALSQPLGSQENGNG